MIAKLDDIKTSRELLLRPEERPPSLSPPPRLLAAAETVGIARWFAARFARPSTNAAAMSADGLFRGSNLLYKRLGLEPGGDDGFELVTYLQLLTRRTPPEEWTHDEALQFARDWAVQEVGEQTAFVIMAVTMSRHVARMLASASSRTHTRPEFHSHPHGILHTLAHWGHSLSSFAGLEHPRGCDHVPESRSDSFALDDANFHLVQDSAEKLKMGVLEAGWQPVADVPGEPGKDAIVKKRNEVAADICFWKNFILGKMGMTVLTETELQAVPNG